MTFILIFDFYGSNYDIIYEIQIILIFSPRYYFYSSSHGEFVFLPAQWCCITVTIVGCYFCRFSLFPPFGWVQPLVGISEYVRSTFLIYHHISIYNYFVLDFYRLDNAVSHSLEILFQRNGAMSLSPFLLFFYIIFLCFLLED